MNEGENQKLFPWQRKLIRDIAYGSNTYIVLEKSRRIGGTWAVAIAAVQYCLRTGNNCWFSSSDEKNGREFILYVRQCSEVINAIIGDIFINLKDATTESVTLPNGARISSLSSNPRALRGKDGLIVLDEVALHEQQEELFRAAQGCIIQKGKLVLLSTHDGPATLFYEKCQQAERGEKDWSHHRITLIDAVNEGYALKFAKQLHHLQDPEKINAAFIESVRRGAVSEDAFGQEFMCKPLSLSALLSAEEYDRVALWDVPDTLDPNKVYNDLFIGIDVGRSHDLTVLWAAEQYENPKASGEHDQYDYKTVCVRSIHNEPIPVQHQILAPLVGHPSVQKCLVDMGSVGRSLSDSLADAFGHVEPYSFTQSRKAELCERVKGFVQYQRISLPKGDQRCREDMLSMRRLASKTGTLSYDGHTSFSHADFYMACSMALEAAVTSNAMHIVS